MTMTRPLDPDEDDFVEPEPCPACEGTGWVPSEDDEGDEVECPLCDGLMDDGP
jgi:hypothetical protein